MSHPPGRSAVEHTFYAGVARSRSGSSSFTALALNNGQPKFCSRCAAELSAGGASFCSTCGAAVHGEQ